MSTPIIYGIIVAAGSGSRFGASIPKQFCNLGGRPVLMTSIERLQQSITEIKILLVLCADFVDYWKDKCNKYNFTSPSIVIGGATRWESVKNAISAIPPTDSDAIVLIHDGARPLVNATVVQRLINAVKEGHQGALPVVAVADSLRIITSNGSESVERAAYRAVQTPQAFPLELLRKAYNQPYSTMMTDDASVMEMSGLSDIALVDGDAATLKITHRSDLAAVESLLQQSDEL